MPKGLRLKDAEKARDEIVAEQLKSISELYNSWADDIAKRAEALKKKSNISAELQVKQLEELEAALRKTSKKVANDVASAVKAGMFKVCQSVVSQNADWMESLGFPKDAILAAFSSVPDNVVRNIITGKIYDTGWSLSKSIWGDNEDTLTKVHQIVAGGIAENRPVYDIAKELEQYVRPGAKKQWNLKTESGKMIYPKQVDYNAQRLVRTLSQHAYQQSIKATSSENPFIQKVRWHSTGNRVCEICKKRNGKIYPINKLPMDHPNGFCIMEQLVDDDMDDRLIAWVKGKEDKDLDAFAKKFGFGVEDMNATIQNKMASAIAKADNYEDSDESAKKSKLEQLEKRAAKKSSSMLKNEAMIASKYTLSGLKNKSIQELNEIAKVIHRKRLMRLEGLSEDEADKRFELLIGGNTKNQIIKYVKKYQSELK